MTNVYHALHSHSVGSVLDGFSNVNELCARAKQNGQMAVAITDHGNMFMAYDLYKACKKHGLKPIYGNETYIAPGSNLIKENFNVDIYSIDVIKNDSDTILIDFNLDNL